MYPRVHAAASLTLQSRSSKQEMSGRMAPDATTVWAKVGECRVIALKQFAAAFLV